MFGGKPDLDDIKEMVQTDYSPNSPKLRLSLVSALIEFGFKENLVETARELLEFSTESAAKFIEELEALKPQETEAATKESETKESPIEDGAYL